MWSVLFLLNLAHAKKPAAVEADNPVIYFQGNYSAKVQKAFPPSKFRLYDQEEQRQDLLRDGILMPSQRDTLFRKVGIETKVQKLDQMDRDILVMGARVYNPAQLKKQFPMLSLEELTRLKAELGRIK